MARFRGFFAALLLACLAASCGGGGGGAVGYGDDALTPPPPARPSIRFVARFDNQAKVLTIAPVAGAASIGSAAIGKVAVDTDVGRDVQERTSPNATNASGQAVYSFPIATLPLPLNAYAPHCGGAPFNLKITVTDVNGVQADTEKNLCPAYTTEWGVFSDYGDRAVNLHFASTAAATASYFAPNHEGRTAPGATSGDWTFAIREGDFAQVSASFDSSAPAGATLTAKVSDAFGDFASSTVVNPDPALVNNQGQGIVASLACCHATAATSPDARTVTLILSPYLLGGYNESSPAITYAFRFELQDGVTGATIKQEDGTVTALPFYEPGVWTLQVAPGSIVKFEATPQTPLAMLQLKVYAGGNELATAMTDTLQAGAQLRITCCAR